MENFDERYAKLAEKEKRIIDYWLETGNATEAARRAGYTAKTESTMRSIGSNNLTKLAKYIQPLLEKRANERVASADEVLETLTRVLRRKEEETVVVTCRTRKTYLDETGRRVTEEKEEPVIVKIGTPVREVNKAAELLGKRYNLFTDKLQVQEITPVVIDGANDLKD